MRGSLLSADLHLLGKIVNDLKPLFNFALSSVLDL